MPPLPSPRALWLAAALITLPCALCAAPVPDAAITEFVADNNKLLEDADGDASDWIEIWNASGEAGDLEGYYLTDDPANLTKWQLPAAAFNAEGYVVVFASGKDRSDPAGELHANFRLDASAGAYLALVKPDGTTLASEFADYPEQYEDVAYGSGFGDPQPVSFVSAGDTANWHVPASAIADWTAVDFDDSAWNSGETGIGYDNGGDYLPLIGAGGDVKDEMRSVNPSIYIRIPFEVVEPAGISGVMLRMKWEDGFVAHLNGDYIESQGAPANSQWDTAADGNRSPESLVQSFNSYPVGGALRAGTNVLAIQGLNNSQSSSDFVIVPELVGQQQDLSSPQDGYFVEPTPGAGNGSRVDGLVQDTQFSIDRGTYDAPFDLVISSTTEGAEIRYTLDGSPPSPTQGLVYSDAITIDDTTVVRAMAHKPGFEPTNIDTQTYVFPAGVYGPDMVDALTAVPTISVVTQHATFLNQNAGNDYNEYQSSFEMIFPDGRPGVQEDGGMSNFGGRFTNFTKKSFRITFKKEFGSTKLRFPIFEGFDYPHFPPAQEFDAINLRSGSHDMSRRGGYMATRFVDDTMLEMGNVAPHGRFVHLYLNGNYWGQYHLRERWNADMASSYFGGSKEDYDAISANNSGMEFQPGTPYDGTGAFWTETGNLLRGQDPFVNAAGHMDIPNVVDFMLLWTSGECESEFRAFGSRSRGVPFKFMVRDPDGYMPGAGWSHVHPVTHNGPINAMTELRTGGNPDYAVLLSDRIHKHFFNDGAMTADNSVERLRIRVEEARPGFAAEARRWGFRTVSSWETYVNGWLNTRLPARTPSMISKFKAAGMYPDVIAPVYSQHGGSIAPGAGITMSTNATAIYYTLDGSDPRLAGGAVNPAATLAPFAGDVPTPEDFITAGAGRGTAEETPGYVWKYLDDGSDQGTAWRAVEFDDGTWNEGPSELGYASGASGEGDEFTLVSYIDTVPGGTTQRNATTYFRTTVELENPAAFSFFVVKLKYDDGAAVYANGTEILRTSNLPANAAFDTFSSGGTPSESTFFEFEIPSSNFVDGTNTIAVEIHNSSASSSDISFDMVLRGEVDTSNGNNVTLPVALNEPGTLRARAYNSGTGHWSALNEAFFSIGSVPADASNLVISEFHYHPAEPASAEEIAASTDRDDYEFVEVLNTGPSPIDLTEVYFTDGIGFAFAENTILNSDARLVIVRDIEAFTVRYGDDPNVTIAGVYSGRLSNDGEGIAMFSDDTGDIVEFIYNDQTPWPESADGGGRSLVRTGDTPGDSTSWGANAVIGGAPGYPDGIASGFADWKTANNITEDLADDDRDGIAALAEYAFGSDPNGVAPEEAPRVTIAEDGGNSYLTITYQKNLAADDAQIEIESSGDLETWITDDDMITVSETANPDGETAIVVLRSASPIAPDNDTYLRVTVSL